MVIKRNTMRVLAVAVTLLSLAVAIAAIPAEDPRTDSMRWARSLSNTERLEYARPGHLQGLPVEYRRAVLSTLPSPEERAACWRSVISAYRQTHSVTPEQSLLLGRAEALIGPQLFDGPRTPAQRAAVVSRQVVEFESRCS
jgi:hypothetical protein